MMSIKKQNSSNEISMDTVDSDGVFRREDENKERGNWSEKFDFTLSCIGYAVGLGNVWRFPYLCYRNGGGAFLIPYTLMLAFVGIPLFFFELSLGQYASSGCISMWRISPMFKGLGYAMITLSSLVAIYYNIIIMYIVRYFFASFTSEVPWQSCDNSWNTAACNWVANRTELVNMSTVNGWEMVSVTSNETLKSKSPSLEYWENEILEKSDGLDDLGAIKWDLALCLLFAWVVVFLSLVKGIKSSSKVVYFTATFPYIVLTILLIRGITLDGAWKGVEYYIVPEWERLKDAKVWGDAAVQIFYSLGPASGGLITLASYNKFNNNCLRDALIVPIVNCGTSIFAGFAIFSLIGHMAKELGVDVKDFADSGAGLVFVAYPAGLAQMPAAPFWSILFFFMLFTLGLDSQFVIMETTLSALADEFSGTLRKRKTILTLGLCTAFFLLGLPMCTKGGIYLMTLMDWYIAGFPLLFLALFEVIVVIYIYGYRRFADNIEMMIGARPNIFWIVNWHAITPVAIICIIAFNIDQYMVAFLGDYTFDSTGETLGWLMVAASVFWIPFWMVATWIKKSRASSGGPFSRSVLLSMVNPESEWGPYLPQHRRQDKHLDDYTENVIENGKDNPALDWGDAKPNTHM